MGANSSYAPPSTKLPSLSFVTAPAALVKVFMHMHEEVARFAYVNPELCEGMFGILEHPLPPNVMLIFYLSLLNVDAAPVKEDELTQL